VLHGRKEENQNQESFGSLFFVAAAWVWGQKSQRIAKQPLRFLCDVKIIFLKSQMPSVAKVAEIRRAITSLFLQLFHSLICKSQDYLQRSRSNKSFGRGGQRRVARLGRKKLAEQTTFKQI
jgi:hypothetical protein